jgi:hypothetical protein
MRALKYTRFAVIAVVFLFIMHFAARAQDDETPEQKKLMQTLMQREQMAAEERSGTSDYVSPEARLMQEKESNRSNMIREEERDATQESEGAWQDQENWNGR